MTATTNSPASGLALARPLSFWLDDETPPDQPRLVDDIECDLLVVGGGFTGLWTALKAKERQPDRNVVLVEARTVGWAASGRNGGFVSPSLTHGIANGHNRWPSDMPTLERLGMDNLAGLERDVARYGIDCSFERTGEITVATTPDQLEDLQASCDLAARYGRTVQPLDGAQLRDRVSSPTFLGGVFDPDGCALVNPAKLAWGLRNACLTTGVRVFERTRATAIADTDRGIRVHTPYATVAAKHVVLATNAFPALLRRLRAFTVPVYDYALVTEPLTDGQRSAIGWPGREGLADAGNQFHYFRLTADDRILWGGYDAIYHYGNGIEQRYDQRPETFTLLASQLVDTFPALAGISFSHAWGGVIDTCTRFSAFYGTAKKGRVAYALGFTGLGVGTTRFAADVVLDLLAGAPTERTALELVRRRPLPFPPEPVRYAGIQLTRRALAKADRDGGRRNFWLRTLDRLGIGFDS